MCNRYVSPQAGDIERYWHVGGRTPWRGAEVFPRAAGPFIRRAADAADAAEPRRELVIGQWGLVPWFAKTAKLTYSTNNARFEEIETKASFKHPWQHAKRCIIPAQSFDEPNWESGTGRRPHPPPRARARGSPRTGPRVRFPGSRSAP